MHVCLFIPMQSHDAALALDLDLTYSRIHGEGTEVEATATVDSISRIEIWGARCIMGRHQDKQTHVHVRTPDLDLAYFGYRPCSREMWTGASEQSRRVEKAFCQHGQSIQVVCSRYPCSWAVRQDGSSLRRRFGHLCRQAGFMGDTIYAVNTAH